jgi:hypothetical protein
MTTTTAHKIPPDLESIPTAARIARVHIRTIQLWIKRGYITRYGRPKAYRVSLSEVIPITAHPSTTAQPRKTGWNRAPEADAKATAARSARRASRNRDSS